jgi:hypothetical protein
MYACSRTNQTFIGLFLMAAMLATRFHHFGDALHLPDASWAVFFIAGFYLAPGWLAALVLQAVAIDAAAVGWMGVPAYCITPAYAALLLAYALLWAGGRWLRGRYREDLSGLRNFAAAALLAVSLAFVLSNTSFYWLGGRVAEPGMGQFVEQFLRYYPGYLGINALYLALAGLVHALASQRVLLRRKA